MLKETRERKEKNENAKSNQFDKLEPGETSKLNKQKRNLFYQEIFKYRSEKSWSPCFYPCPQKNFHLSFCLESRNTFWFFP